eukprot:1595587-Alexandrium_andersonii.AAC.1
MPGRAELSEWAVAQPLLRSARRRPRRLHRCRRWRRCRCLRRRRCCRCVDVGASMRFDAPF